MGVVLQFLQRHPDGGVYGSLIIRRVKPSKCMLGDAAYDSGELREQLDGRGTKPVSCAGGLSRRSIG
jgi:hypothetical protein